MSLLLYREKPFLKRLFLIPIYILPVLIGITSSYHIVPLFTVLFSILLFLSTCWSSKFRIFLSLYPSKSPTLILYENKLCEVSKDTFEFNKTKYMIKGNEIIRLSPNLNKKFGFFKNRTEPLIDSTLKSKFNKNYFKIDSPSFGKLFMQHAVSPFFVFQIFCGILWCLDEYVYQALFTIVMLFLIEAGLVLQRIINFRQFRTMNHSSIKIEVIDGGKIKDGGSGCRDKDDRSSSKINISSSSPSSSLVDSLELFPGDVIRISNNIRLPCDILLLKGSCAVNEAMLSGESIPLSKEDIREIEDNRDFDITKDKKHILFAGTDIVKIDEECIEGYVLLIGFDTQQGELIKKMMASEDVSINDKEAFGFIGVLLAFAIMAGAYTWREGLKMNKTPYKIFLEVILIITNVVPTELPLELSMAVNSCVKSLMDLGVFCLEPFRIPLAGKVNVCCFDKTGTLTETSMEVSEIKYPNKFTVDILRNCHSLISIEGRLSGDPLEIGMNQYLTSIAISQLEEDGNKVGGEHEQTNKVGDEHEQTNKVVGEHEQSNKVGGEHEQSNKIGDEHEQDSEHKKADKLPTYQTDNSVHNPTFFKWVKDSLDSKYSILKKYSFSSELKRMTVIGEISKKDHPNSVFVGMKGAPEVVEKFLSVVPEEFYDYKKFAEDGYRVIALAYKPYSKVSSKMNSKMTSYDRKSVEKDLIFSGFILFSCRLKHNAKETVRALKESGHKVVMITGDNLLTAISVAKKVGIDPKEVEGDSIDQILESKDFEDYSVFARADPLHKEKILEKYNKKGMYTLMCGDGTNDVGALKMAHIGVALVDGGKVNTNNSSFNAHKQNTNKPNSKSTTDNVDDTPQKKILRRLEKELNESTTPKMGDASVAAPFTAKTGSLESILNIIRQGRSALVTTIQMYKILGLNSLVNAFSLSVLDCMGIRFGEVQMVGSGILVAFAFMFLTSNQPLKEISKKRPLSNIFNPYIILSVLSQVIVHIVSYFVVINRVRKIEILEYKEKFEPSLLNTCLFYLSTSQQLSTFLVNYIGRPFRESLLENKKLSTCLLCLFTFILYLIFEMNPDFNKFMEVVSLGEMRRFMLYVIGLDIYACYVLEKICFFMFLL